MFNIGDRVKIMTKEPEFSGKIGIIEEAKTMRIGMEIKNRYLVKAEGLGGAMRIKDITKDGAMIKEMIPNARYYYEEHLEIVKGE